MPFLADLVTLADPTSPYSFLAYLHERGRLYRFYFHERLHALRREFDDYYRWASERLRPAASARRSRRCAAGRATAGPSSLAGGAEHRARAVVLGVGSVPSVPDCALGMLGSQVHHTRRLRRAPRAHARGCAGHGHRLGPERGRGRRRPARPRARRAGRVVHARRRLPADGVLQARPRALLARVHGALPRPARGAPRRAARRAGPALQGHLGGHERAHLRRAVPPQHRRRRTRTCATPRAASCGRSSAWRTARCGSCCTTATRT